MVMNETARCVHKIHQFKVTRFQETASKRCTLPDNSSRPLSACFAGNRGVLLNALYVQAVGIDSLKRLPGSTKQQLLRNRYLVLCQETCVNVINILRCEGVDEVSLQRTRVYDVLLMAFSDSRVG